MGKYEYDSSDKKDDDDNKADGNKTGGNTFSDNVPHRTANLQGERKLHRMSGNPNRRWTRLWCMKWTSITLFF